MINAENELLIIRKEIKEKRKKRFRPSKIDRYKGEIISLYDEGAKVTEIHYWLEDNGLQIARSTVSRWIKNNIK